jgi:hypothetical protein
MPTTYLTRRWGSSSDDPSEEEMREAVAELAISDPEHPDCWLSDQENWGISIGESAIAVLENAETLEGPWHLQLQSREEILPLWMLMQAGDWDSIRAKPWLEGYSS